jgi:hypothetical protein
VHTEENMTTKNELVIIMSPYSSISILICEELKNHPYYEVYSLSTMEDLEKFLADRVEVGFAVIDSEFGCNIVFESAKLIREKTPSVHLVLVAQNEVTAEIDGLNPWKIMRKPLITSDISALFGSHLDFHRIDPTETINIETSETRNWSEVADQTEMINSMSHVLSELDAIEAYFYSKKGIKIKTNNAGLLDSDNGFRIMEDIMIAYGSGEVIKKITLNSKNYLLNTIILEPESILGLLYSVDVPYPVIRKQTKYFLEILRQGEHIDKKKGIFSSQYLSIENDRFDKNCGADKKQSKIKDYSSQRLIASKYYSKTDNTKIITFNARAIQ